MNENTETPRPTLVYDGDCGICAWWVRYWQRLTGERVRYGSYQTIGGEFPTVDEQQFAAAIHLIGLPGDDAPRRGALAAFTVLKLGGRWFPYLLLCRFLPGFALIAEWVYRNVATRRPLFARATWLLWGRRELQPPRHDQVAWLLLRLLGLWYLAAFISFAVQAQGLIGSQGIVPVAEFVARVQVALGADGWWRLPMVFHWNASDSAIDWVTWGGAALAALVVVGRLVTPALAACVLLYLSLVHGGQDFMRFQWDLLLIECGVLGVLLSAARGRVRNGVIWLWRWLLFRFIFLSGVVKVASGDVAWRDMTALGFHFETQPLPTVLAWYAHHSPAELLQAMTWATLIIELPVVFLLFLPRRLRFFGAGLFVLLQLAILATGNYNWFNLLSLTLCLAALDDAALGRLLPGPMARLLDRRAAHSIADTATDGEVQSGFARRGVNALVATVVPTLAAAQFLLASALLVAKLDLPLPAWVEQGMRIARPYALASNYGPFSVMTRVRRELEIQGSDDGVSWRSYRWRYKPDGAATPMPWIIPHQPRLDWQAWFVVLGPPRSSPWLGGLIRGLLEGRAPVLALFADNPFPGHPPQYLRMNLNEYRYTTPTERADSGDWWVVRPIGRYLQARARR